VFASGFGFSDEGIERSKDFCDVFKIVRRMNTLSLTDDRSPGGFAKPESIAKEWCQIWVDIVQYWCLSKPSWAAPNAY
jgi:hypothetical protein